MQHEKINYVFCPSEKHAYFLFRPKQLGHNNISEQALLYF